MTAPVKDGQANSGNAFHSSASGTVTLTTSNAGDAIILEIVSQSVVANVSTISSANTTGWTRRGTRQSYGASRNVNMEVWYGFAAVALTAEIITVTLDASVDGASIEAFGVSSAVGAYNADPFDLNVSLPGFASHQDFTTFVSTTPTVTGLTTDDAAPLVLGFFGSTAGTTATAGTGFTLDDTNNSAFGVHNAISGFEHKAPGAALSGASETFGNSTFDWGMIVDAIVNPILENSSDAAASSNRILAEEISSDILLHEAISSDKILHDAASSDKAIHDALSSELAREAKSSNDALSSDFHALNSDQFASSNRLLAEQVSSDILAHEAKSSDDAVSSELAREAKSSDDALSSDTKPARDAASSEAAMEAASSDALLSEQVSSDIQVEIRNEPAPPIQVIGIMS